MKINYTDEKYYKNNYSSFILLKYEKIMIINNKKINKQQSTYINIVCLFKFQSIKKRLSIFSIVKGAVRFLKIYEVGVE